MPDLALQINGKIKVGEWARHRMEVRVGVIRTPEQLQKNTNYAGDLRNINASTENWMISLKSLRKDSSNK